MKKIYISFLTLLILATSCQDLTDLNVNPKSPQEVASSSLFSNAEIRLASALSSSNVNSNIFRLLAQHWTETTYTSESRYNLTTRTIPDNFWLILYRNVLNDLEQAKQVNTNDATITPEVKANRLAMIEIMQVYTYSVLVNTFGDIPYTQALDINNIQPTYDKAQDIYNDLFKRLDAALNSFKPEAQGFGESDLLYNGDIAKWQMFGNSLKLRLGMTIADVDPTQAKTLVEAAAKNVFTSNDDNALFKYSTVPPNTNPIWVDLVQSGRNDFVPANTLVDTLNYLEDPRRDNFFTLDPDSTYSGGRYGASNNYFAFSHVNENITAENFPGVFMDYSEVEFYLAEAVERGFNVGGTAVEHYNNAITANIEYWGGTEEEAEAYLLKPSVNYLTAKGDYRQKIGFQKWIALYNRGFEAWTEWRRLDAPALKAPARAVSVIPLRYTYPVSEQNLNKTNYNAAVSNIGTDEVGVKLFWDKF